MDIIDRKGAEEALREKEEKYRVLVDNANEMVMVAQDGEFKFINQRVFDVLGYEPEELVGKPFLDYIHPDDRETVADRHLKRLKGEDLPPVYPFRVIDKEGRSIWVEISAVRIDWEGKPATLNYLSDITERKWAEKELYRLQSQLRRSQKMEAVGTLAGGIAHDFNNILAATIGYAELAKANAKDENLDVKEDLDEVLNSAYRAKALVKQILTVSRDHEQERKPVQFSVIVKEALKFMRSTLPATIEFHQNIAAESGKVEADPTQLHQVLMNLCTNAMHAMEEYGGELTVSLTEEVIPSSERSQPVDLEPGTYLKLAVRDTGSGIPYEIRERIFDPYFTTKKKGEGTGLGLSTTLAIVESHGGTITVESQMGKGSTFSVYLPVIEAQEDLDEPKEQPPLPTGQERILFIDDEEALLEACTGVLEKLGYQVTPQTSSVTALELFKKDPAQFDLIITDMTMPQLTGDHLAQKMLGIRPDIPIIICTGYSEKISEERAKEIGIQSLALKPLEMSNFAWTVRKILDQK